MFLAILIVVLLLVALRWTFFVRLRVAHAPYCPVCRESRGRILGVGEQTSQPYFRCPHCGHVFGEDG
jgi:hypothetical protein